MKKTALSLFITSLFLTACNGQPTPAPSQSNTNKSASQVVSVETNWPVSDSAKLQTPTGASSPTNLSNTPFNNKDIPITREQIQELLIQIVKVKQNNGKLEDYLAVLKDVPITDDIRKEFNAQVGSDIKDVPKDEQEMLLRVFALTQYEQYLISNQVVQQETKSIIDDYSETVYSVLDSYKNFALKGQYDKAETQSEKKVLAKIKSNLNQITKGNDKTKINVVKEFSIKGLFVVYINDVPSGMITNENGDYFVVLEQRDPINLNLNHLLSKDAKRVNLNTPESQAIYKDLLSHIKPTIKHVFGKGERHLYVFSDPDCPFCREQDKEIHANFTADDNVTVFQIMNPLQSLHPYAYPKAAHLLCLNDPSGEWLKMQQNDGKVDSFKPEGYDPKAYTKDIKLCLEEVSLNKGLAEIINFHSTPSMITGDGIVLINRHQLSDIRIALNGKVPTYDVHPNSQAVMEEANKAIIESKTASEIK